MNPTPQELRARKDVAKGFVFVLLAIASVWFLFSNPG